MNVTRYNAKDCVITVNGTYITGLGESMVEGEKDEDFFEDSTGAQGDIVVNEINDTKGTITLTVQQTCPQRKMLMQLATSNKEFPFWAVNKSLGTRMGGSKCRIISMPTFKQGKSAEDLEIKIRAFDYTVQ